MPGLNHSRVLQTGIDRLSPQQKGIRIAFDAYLKSHRRRTAQTSVARFRRFAEYLKYGRDRWHKAVDRLFSNGPAEAEKVSAGYRKWLLVKYVCARTRYNLNDSGFQFAKNWPACPKGMAFGVHRSKLIAERRHGPKCAAYVIGVQEEHSHQSFP